MSNEEIKIGYREIQIGNQLYYDLSKELVEYFNQLQQENKKYKEVIEKAKTELDQGITFCQNDSQGLYDKCNIAINREQKILDILKEVE